MQRKRLKSLLLCLIVAISLLAKPAVTFAESRVISVSADKTETSPGDIITFSVILGPVEDMGTMQMALVIPDGLSYVSGSGKLADGLKNTLGYDTISFAENTKIINGYASAADYSSGTETLICTFQCKVEDDFSGIAEVGLTDLEFYSCQTWEDHTDEFSPGKVVISVSADTIPSSDENPDQQTEPSPSDNPTPDGTEPSDNTEPGDTSPSGNSESGDTTSSGDTESGDTSPSGNSESGDTTPSGDTESGDTSPSGDTDPEDTTPSDSTTPGDTTPEDTVPSDSSDLTPTDSGEQSLPDTDPSETNTVPGENEGSPKTDDDSHESDENSESTLPWWAVLSAVILAIVVLLIVFKQRKNNKKVVDALNKQI